jgi:hypothetical protein
VWAPLRLVGFPQNRTRVPSWDRRKETDPTVRVRNPGADTWEPNPGTVSIPTHWNMPLQGLLYAADKCSDFKKFPGVTLPHKLILSHCCPTQIFTVLFPILIPVSLPMSFSNRIFLLRPVTQVPVPLLWNTRILVLPSKVRDHWRYLPLWGRSSPPHISDLRNRWPRSPETAIN